MAKFDVYMQTALCVEVEAETPEQAAHYARDRVMATIRGELPPCFTGGGFEPHFRWRVRPAGIGRPQPVVIAGNDEHLCPRATADD